MRPPLPVMTIVELKPPAHIWDRVHKLFQIDDRYTIYAYGDRIFNPAHIPMDPHLVRHETEHARQQLATFGGPDVWWDKYFTDPVFRADQEAEAYAAQYISFTDYNHDRNAAALYLKKMGDHLAGGTYGLTMHPQEARNAIMDKVKTWKN